jgi:hypothetical protein
LLKANKDIEDVKYWALRNKVDNSEIRFVALQQDKESLQWHVSIQAMEIFKVKEGFQIIMHQWDEAVREKDIT